MREGREHTTEQEPGYRAVLVREETKKHLQAFRARLPGRDLAQERRLATAALQLVLSRPELHELWMAELREVVRADLRTDPPRL
jgi:hypothetical protein